METINEFYVYRDNGNGNYDNLLRNGYSKYDAVDLIKIWLSGSSKLNLREVFDSEALYY